MAPHVWTAIAACTLTTAVSAHGTHGWEGMQWSKEPWPASTATTPSTCAATRTTSYSSFQFTELTTTRYATPLPSPLALTTTWAPAFSEASSLLPDNLTYTTYSLDRNATSLQDGQYGQGAYARLWTTLSFNNTVPFTTTVSPTPVPSSELIFPPALYTACPQAADDCIDCYKLPKDFMWGVAGSAYQIEGGLTSDGRGPSDYDSIGALPNLDDMANAEIANMNYWLYKQDIARIAAIGMPYYSFSIPWTRVVPFGKKDSPINTAALDHYEDLIDTCIEYGVKPIVTLVHFDVPAGVTYNNTDFPDALLYYAKQVMTRYGDRVSHWFTLNEPNLAIHQDYNFSVAATILMGHAKVFHWYKEELKGTGGISLKFANNLAVPLDHSNPDDTRASLRYQDFNVGILANPLFLGTNYPAEILNTTGIDLAPLTDDQLAYINGTMDYISFDPYTTGFATSPPGGIDACAANTSDPLWPFCVVNTNVQQDGWLNGQGSYAYAYITPQYVRQQLGILWNTYRPKGIVISEFGFNPFSEFAETVVAQQYDLERTLYYQWFLREMLKAIYEDNVNVMGAFAWSFLDNDEFGSFLQQYGLQHVNRTTWERKYKRSMFDYVDFFHEFVAEG